MDLDFFPDTLTIEASGKQLRAQTESKGSILVHGDQAVISPDDVLVRTLSNGLVERYTVLDAVYQKGDDDLPAVTRVKVHKAGTKARPAPVPHVTYNVTGPNSRINVSSHDASTNVVDVRPERLFSDLEAALSSHTLAASEKQRLLLSIKEMRAAQGTPAFPGVFQRFMSFSANCMTVISPFLPAITQLLHSGT